MFAKEEMKMNTLNLQNLTSDEILKVIEDYMWKARMARIEEYKEQDNKTKLFGSNFGNYCAIPKINFDVLKNGVEIQTFELSVQASENHYCSPRENLQEVYEEVEIGFPNFNFSEGFIKKYAEDVENPQDTVYGFVPLNVLALELYNLINELN